MCDGMGVSRANAKFAQFIEDILLGSHDWPQLLTARKARSRLAPITLYGSKPYSDRKQQNLGWTAAAFRFAECGSRPARRSEYRNGNLSPPRPVLTPSATATKLFSGRLIPAPPDRHYNPPARSHEGCETGCAVSLRVGSAPARAASRPRTRAAPDSDRRPLRAAREELAAGRECPMSADRQPQKRRDGAPRGATRVRKVRVHIRNGRANRRAVPLAFSRARETSQSPGAPRRGNEGACPQ